MTAESSAAVTAAAPAWSWPVRAAQFDRSATLSIAERAALDTLGWDVRRWPEHWKDSRLRRWQAVHRLVLPLAQAVERALSTWLGLSGIGACRGWVGWVSVVWVGCAVSPVTSLQTANRRVISVR